MATERITCRIIGQMPTGDPGMVAITISNVMSVPTGTPPFTDGNTDVIVNMNDTEASIYAVLAEASAAYVMTQTAPNVYTAADVRLL